MIREHIARWQPAAPIAIKVAVKTGPTPEQREARAAMKARYPIEERVI